jgi:hypothetical protein
MLSPAYFRNRSAIRHLCIPCRTENKALGVPTLLRLVFDTAALRSWAQSWTNVTSVYPLSPQRGEGRGEGWKQPGAFGCHERARNSHPSPSIPLPVEGRGKQHLPRLGQLGRMHHRPCSPFLNPMSLPFSFPRNAFGLANHPFEPFRARVRAVGFRNTGENLQQTIGRDLTDKRAGSEPFGKGRGAGGQSQ